MSTEAELRVPIGPPNKTQRELFEFEPPPNLNKVYLGLLSAGYGSGKTWGAALRFAREVSEIEPWDPDGNQQRPKALVISVTNANLRSNIIPMLERLLMGQVISKRVTPIPVWTLVNGVQIEFYAVGSMVEGMSARVIWVDEVTHPSLLDRPGVWRNLKDRLRGFKGKRKTMIVSGIAAMHPVIRERFCRPDDPAFHILLPGIRENQGLDEDTINDMLDGVPEDWRDAVEHGGWIPLRESVYQIDEDLHRYDGPIDRRAPVGVGYDPGKSACAVVGMDIDGVFVIVDEIIGTELDSEAIMQRVVARGWHNVSTVVLDSQASPDTWPAIARVLPNAFPVQQPKRSAAWRVQHGIERVQWALRSAGDVTRLQFAGALWDHGHRERGVIKSLSGYRFKPTGQPVRDNVLDHQCDAVRMLVMAMVELPEHAQGGDYSSAYVEAW